MDNFPEDKASSETNKVNIIEIYNELMPFKLTFAEVITGEEDCRWDVIFSGEIIIEDEEKYLKAYGLSYLVSQTALSAEIIQSWVNKQVEHKVRDYIDDYTLKELKEEDVLPLEWWEEKLKEWLEDCGLKVRLDDIKWESSEFENLQEEKARTEALEKLKENQKKQYEAEIDQLKNEVEYEKKKEEIKKDKQLSEMEKETRLEVLEKKHKKKRIKARKEAEKARYEAEKEKLKHEKELAELRNELEKAEENKEKMEESEDKFQQTLNQLNEMNDTLEKIADNPEKLLAKLGSGDSQEVYKASEKLKSPEFDLTPEEIENLGFEDPRQFFIDRIEDKIASDGDLVNLKKKELNTRDVMTQQVKVLEINTSLQFEINSQKSGFVTFINIGTSGAISLHIPNAYVSPKEAKIEENSNVSIPGSHLLPENELRKAGLRYVEAGPEGWEHLVIIVSDTPIISSKKLNSTFKGRPFIQIKQSELIDTYQNLTRLGKDNWTAGHLYFKVE